MMIIHIIWKIIVRISSTQKTTLSAQILVNTSIQASQKPSITWWRTSSILTNVKHSQLGPTSKTPMLWLMNKKLSTRFPPLLKKISINYLKQEDITRISTANKLISSNKFICLRTQAPGSYQVTWKTMLTFTKLMSITNLSMPQIQNGGTMLCAWNSMMIKLFGCKQKREEVINTEIGNSWLSLKKNSVDRGINLNATWLKLNFLSVYAWTTSKQVKCYMK